MGRLLPIIALFFVSLLLSGADIVSGEDLTIAFDEETFSAHVEETPLAVVTDKIENHTGIWFKAGEALLQERVSVVFDGLPFEDGLARILSKMSYSLVFDDDDEIVGVFLFRSLDPRQKQVLKRARRRVPPRSLPRSRALPARRPQSFRN
jgi:hypothetical protein